MLGLSTFLLDLAFTGTPCQFLLNTPKGGGIDNCRMIVLHVILGSGLSIITFDLLADAVYNIGFIEDGVAFVPFILQNRAHRGAVPFSLTAGSGNARIIQHFHNSSHTVPGQEPLINHLDGLSFFGVNFGLAIFAPAVAEEVLVVKRYLSFFSTLIFSPYNIGTDIF